MAQSLSPLSSARLALALLCGMTCGTSVFAGSLAEPTMDVAPAMVPAVAMPAQAASTADWTGGYVGGSLGYAQIDGTFNGADLFAESPDGVAYGIHAGYNRDFGRFVVGGELQYEATNVQEGSSFLKFDSIARAKLRVGYDAGQFMPFATTGVAQASVSNSSFAGEDSGAFAGLGVDYRYTPSLTIGAELLQHRFGDFSGSGVELDATTMGLRASFNF